MTDRGTFVHIPDALVRWEPSEYPVLSCYIDWRVAGRGLHEAATVVRKELHDGAQGLAPRGPARESFDADAARIEAYLHDEADPAAAGLVVFACGGRGLWRTAALGVPVGTSIHVGERPLLLPLVEAAQDAARTLIALADTRTVRLIELDLSGVHEEAGPHRRNPETSRHVAVGGWAQANFQRARDTAVQRFAQEAASAIAEAVDGRGIEHVVIGGDEVISGPLLEELPTHVRDRVDTVEHLDIQAPLHDVAERIWPVAAAVAAAARDTAVAEVASRAAGKLEATAEPAELRELVSAGRVDSLALDPELVEPEAAELLVREALTHRSRLLIAREHAALTEVGGVAATLR